jgi:hypothetical protein
MLNGWMFVSPILLMGTGALIKTLNPWWNEQLARNLESSFPSIGEMMMVSSGFFLITHMLVLLIMQAKKNKTS